MQKSLFARVFTKEESSSLPSEWLDDLVRYCFARLGHKEEAEDVAMDVWHEAARATQRILASDCPRAFLIGMARRRIADHHRQSLRTHPKPAPRDEKDVTHILVDEVLSAIGEEHREVLVLKYVHGFSQEEIGAIIGRSTAATNSLLQRARESFRTHGAHLASDAEEQQ